MQGAPVMTTGTGETRSGALSAGGPHGGRGGAYSPPAMCCRAVMCSRRPGGRLVIARAAALPSSHQMMDIWAFGHIFKINCLITRPDRVG